jgi:hypothetical protein
MPRMSLFEMLADLPVAVDGYELERREQSVSSGFTRVTTTVVMHGGGEKGEGEDVTYIAADHECFPADISLAGNRTLAEQTGLLDGRDLFAAEPQMDASHDYRRWAFDSAALDLALRQAGTSLGAAVGRTPQPVRFVASTRDDIDAWLAVDPKLEFKLDADASWDQALIRRLADTGRVRVIDLKAYYRGTAVDLEPDPVLYRAIAENLPEAVIEDPWLQGAAGEALSAAAERLSFDAPVHSFADVESLPVSPRWLNIKPSRFGTLQRLLECVEACEERGIAMYGGGQFELGPGRRQIQTLASVFYASGPNDVAPREYNVAGPRRGLPHSPLPAFAENGF